MIVLNRHQKYGFLLALVCLLSIHFLYIRPSNFAIGTFTPFESGSDLNGPVTSPSSPSLADPLRGQSLQIPPTDFLHLHDVEALPKSYNPYPQLDKTPWSLLGKSSRRACRGPHLGEHGSASGLIKAYPVSPEHPNPLPMFGSYGEMGMDDGHCFDRSSRFAPYGYSDDNLGGNSTPWDAVDWGSLQELCIEENQDQFKVQADTALLAHLRSPGASNVTWSWLDEQVEKDNSQTAASKPPKRARTAVVLRGWDTLEYTTELRQHIRANINELSLQTGGEYAVYLMVEVKDLARDIFGSSAAYAQAIVDFVPQEFHSLTLLFNQALLEAWYPGTNPANGGQMLHMNQPLQLFSLFNQQFDFVWGVELDVRFTGNWFNLLSSMAAWSKNSPRKLQWERASTFYIPSHHGTYEKFTRSLLARLPDGGIWGPVSNQAAPTPLGPLPPSSSAADDDFQWGIGEEADDITPSAVIDTTDFGLFSYFPVTGFENTSQRRALMVTPVKRLSRRLLMAMHQAQVDGFDMRSELFAHTIALAHGMKIAHAPVPMYFDDQTKEPAEVDAIFNNGREKSRIWADGANELSLLAMSNTTYWWRLEFEQLPRVLYRRWYGLDGDGIPLRDEPSRLCLPGIMLHPVKDVVRDIT